MITFSDRVSDNPNKRKIKILSTGEEILADISYADLPQCEGTPLNAKTFNDMQREIMNHIDKITADTEQLVRSATVVVGLASSGYTESQVDVLIKPTDSVAAKLNEAMSKLPPIGGEIKLLEGIYNLNTVDFTINKDCTISGTGYATQLKYNSGNGIILRSSTTITIQNMYLHNDNADGYVIESFCNQLNIINCAMYTLWKNYIAVSIGNASILNVTAETIERNAFVRLDTSILKISNSDITVNDKTASNWRNIFVDGQRQYDAFIGNHSLDENFSIPTICQIGDILEVTISVSNIAANQVITINIAGGYQPFANTPIFVTPINYAYIEAYYEAGKIVFNGFFTTKFDNTKTRLTGSSLIKTTIRRAA